MKKGIYLFFLLSISLLSSCFDDSEGTVFTEALVEFDVSSFALPTGTPGVVTILNGSGNVTTNVNLVGPQLSSDVNLNVEIVPELTTGISGTNYTIAGTLTIPANQSVIPLSINILPDASLTTAVDVAVRLVGNDDVDVNPNFNTVIFRITP